MCIAIALARSTLPTELIEQYGLGRHTYDRGGEPEFQFWYDDRTPRLPIRRDGELQIVRWGNLRGQSRALPRESWIWQKTIADGVWRELEPVLVDIPAMLGYEGGTWYTIHQGIRGLLVPDETGKAVVYLVCEPSSHYYRIMTRCQHMPVFIKQRI